MYFTSEKIVQKDFWILLISRRILKILISFEMNWNYVHNWKAWSSLLHEWYVKMFLGGLQKSSSFQIGQHFDDVLGHRGRSGQVITSSLETVLIGNPVDSNDNIVISSVRIRAFGNGTDVFGFRSDQFLRPTFFYLGTIFSFEAMNDTDVKKVNIIKKIIKILQMNKKKCTKNWSEFNPNQTS